MWQGQGKPRAEEWHVEAIGQREGQEESEERRKRTRREMGAAHLESVQLLAAGATGVAGDEAGEARRICFHRDRCIRGNRTMAINMVKTYVLPCFFHGADACC